MNLNNQNEFFHDLLGKIVKAISEGYSRILILGINSNTIRLLTDLYKNGLLTYINGIVENKDNFLGTNIYGIKVYAYEQINNIEYDAVVIPYDAEKEDILKKFMQYENTVKKILFSGNNNYRFSDLVFNDILSSCSVKPKSGGYQNMLVHIYQSLKYLSLNKIYGAVVEFGVYRGGTTVFMAKVLQHFNNPSKIYGFDTFTGFPPPKSSLDMFDDSKYQLTDFNVVKRYCSPYNIELIKGDICETCECIKGKTLSFAFFDTDNYSATKKALETCYDQMIPGGILAFDHYYSPNWLQTLGERMAIKQVMKKKFVLNLHGTGIFLK